MNTRSPEHQLLKNIEKELICNQSISDESQSLINERLRRNPKLLRATPHYEEAVKGITSGKDWELLTAKTFKPLTLKELTEGSRPFHHQIISESATENNEKLLLVTFQGNESHLLPRYNKLSTCFVPRFCGIKISQQLKENGAELATLRFRDPFQLWYSEPSLEKHVQDTINKTIHQLKPKKVIFLGSSAGGYAAIKFSQKTKPHPNTKLLCIANCPQYAVISASFTTCFFGKYRKELTKALALEEITFDNHLISPRKDLTTTIFSTLFQEDALAAEKYKKKLENQKMLLIKSANFSHAQAPRDALLKLALDFSKRK